MQRAAETNPELFSQFRAAAARKQAGAPPAEPERNVDPARVRQVFTQLLKGGWDPNEAAAEALKRATEELFGKPEDKSLSYYTANNVSAPAPAPAPASASVPASVPVPPTPRSNQPVVQNEPIFAPRPASSLPMYREQKLRDLFRMFDLSGDGLVSLDEFLVIGQAIYGNENWTEAANTAAFGRVDTDGSGTIDVVEFVAIFERSMESVDEARFEELLLRYEGAAALCVVNAAEAKAAAAKAAAVKAAAVKAAATKAAETKRRNQPAAKKWVKGKPERPSKADRGPSRFTEYGEGLTPFWIDAVKHMRGDDMAHFVEHPEHFVEPTGTLKTWFRGAQPASSLSSSSGSC